MELLPVLQPDVELARNLRRHLLSIPGEPATSVHMTITQAVERCLAHGFDSLVLLIDGNHYIVNPAQTSLLTVLDTESDGVPSPDPPMLDVTKEKP